MYTPARVSIQTAEMHISDDQRPLVNVDGATFLQPMETTEAGHVARGEGSEMAMGMVADAAMDSAACE